MIVGPEESGKTGLLQHIARLCLKGEFGLGDFIPIPWSGSQVVKGRRDLRTRLEKELQKRTNTPGDIMQVSVLLLIDDLDLTPADAMERLEELDKLGANVRVIMTTLSASLKEYRGLTSEELGFRCRIVFIGQFGLGEIRALVKQVTKVGGVDREEVFQHVVSGVTSMRMPRTPAVVLLILLAVLEADQRLPENQAVLMERVARRFLGAKKCLNVASVLIFATRNTCLLTFHRNWRVWAGQVVKGERVWRVWPKLICPSAALELRPEAS